MTGGGAQHPDVLREEIQQTRAELGQTLQALAAKVDVKSRVKESAAQRTKQLRGQAMQKRDQLRDQAMLKREQLRGQAAQRKEQLRGQGKERVRGHLWHGSYNIRGSAREIGTLIRRYPVPVAVGAGIGAAVVTFLAARRRHE